MNIASCSVLWDWGVDATKTKVALWHQVAAGRRWGWAGNGQEFENPASIVIKAGVVCYHLLPLLSLLKNKQIKWERVWPGRTFIFGVNVMTWLMKSRSETKEISWKKISQGCECMSGFWSNDPSKMQLNIITVTMATEQPLEMFPQLDSHIVSVFIILPHFLLI